MTVGFKLRGCAFFVLFKKKKKSSSSIFVRPKSIKVSSNLLKSFVQWGELVNEIGRPLSRGRHPSEVRGHAPCCQVTYFINRGPTHSDAPAGARLLRMAMVCLRGPRVLVLSPPHKLLFRGKNALPPTTTPPPPTHTCSAPSAPE